MEPSPGAKKDKVATKKAEETTSQPSVKNKVFSAPQNTKTFTLPTITKPPIFEGKK